MTGNYSTREYREKLYDDLHVRLRDTTWYKIPATKKRLGQKS